MPARLSGIGVVVRRQNGRMTVARLLPGGPAARSGQVQPGDEILGVAEGHKPFVPAAGLKLDTLETMMLDREGSVVRLRLRPAGVQNTSRGHAVTLVRAEVKLTEGRAQARLVKKRLADGTVQKLGWLRVPSFYEGAEGTDDAGGISADAAGVNAVHKPVFSRDPPGPHPRDPFEGFRFTRPREGIASSCLDQF